nr:MoxR family ATPase [Oscillochloris trichoides]
MSNWKIYTGQGRNAGDDPITRLPSAPPWRDFADPERDKRRGQVFRPSDHAIEMVNAALYLRRPLLVTGKPGIGKSTLARAVAEELNLTLYEWPINTRTVLQDGLYRYDALARLRDAQGRAVMTNTAQEVGQYITLGPLGMALLPVERPSVLLIDEIDKGDIDLPNDLLHVFEEGEFFITEITRLLQRNSTVEPSHMVAVCRPDGSQVNIPDGRVRCRTFPLVIMTSNGERDFPPAFLRRCLRLDIEPPREVDELEAIVRAHLGEKVFAQAEAMIKQYVAEFLRERDRPDVRGHIATDQLLNLIYMATQEQRPDAATEQVLRKELLRRLGSE